MPTCRINTFMYIYTFLHHFSMLVLVIALWEDFHPEAKRVTVTTAERVETTDGNTHVLCCVFYMLSAESGGAIEISEIDYLLVEYSSFSRCTSSESGGCIYLSGVADAVFSNNEFRHSVSYTQGNAVYAYSNTIARLRLLQNAFRACGSIKYGEGCLFTYISSISERGSNNTACAAMYAPSHSAYYMVQGTPLSFSVSHSVVHTSSVYEGYIISLVHMSSITISNSLFVYCESPADGGLVVVWKETVFTGCVIYGNSIRSIGHSTIAGLLTFDRCFIRGFDTTSSATVTRPLSSSVEIVVEYPTFDCPTRTVERSPLITLLPTLTLFRTPRETQTAQGSALHTPRPTEPVEETGEADEQGGMDVDVERSGFLLIAVLSTTVVLVAIAGVLVALSWAKGRNTAREYQSVCDDLVSVPNYTDEPVEELKVSRKDKFIIDTMKVIRDDVQCVKEKVSSIVPPSGSHGMHTLANDGSGSDTGHEYSD
jgi:hypothetical protein